MQGAMIGFIIGSFATALFAYYIATIFIKARVDKMIEAETEIRIKDLQFEIEIVKKKLRITEQQKDIAIEYSKQTLEERNEALLMLSKRL